MAKKQKSNNQLLVISILSLGLLAVLYLVKNTTIFGPKAAPVSFQYKLDMETPPMESANDLDKQLQYLSKMDLDQINNQLQLNLSDSQEFLQNE